MELSYQVHPGRGPHLLLVHGFLTGPAQWRTNVPELARHCIPVTVSLWGHAGAPAPAEPELYHPAGYVTGFERIRARLGAERWFLLGYSLGAGLTIRYALTHPERVLGHAFTNSTSAMADAEQRRAWREGADASAAAIRLGGHAAMEKIPVHPRNARRLSHDLYDALCEDAARHDPVGIANTLLHTNPHVSVREHLGDNVRPALLLCGARERRFRTHRDYAATHMPNLEVVDLDAGHGMNMEASEAFNNALAEFLRACLTS